MDLGAGDRVDRLRHLCRLAMRMLPASGAGLSVVARDSQVSLLAAADPVSQRLEELQFVLGEGPCVDASADRSPVLVADLAGEGLQRWPAYASAVLEAGMCAVFAFPLQIGAAQLGVLDLFRAGAGSLTGAELERALTLADRAVTVLLTDGPDGDEPLGATTELFQAQGMVMVQIGGTLPEAMARIRAYAYARDRRLADVARAIVARELRFERDG
ncbi:GAF domain-containing protein [Amorphoplanes auranticolor]|uniref:GAF domain-containing protein n=2 Tax=Actinoplanes auranticolor TaxID=47988 RepID=A0A919SEP2_9ACTN|nr:GAF and ANTAR domain-containing protein [Actinoplanes auranticolor]GIM70262.1 GAF domain-containing protein [Actinoplanes auranticolor]